LFTPSGWRRTKEDVILEVLTFLTGKTAATRKQVPSFPFTIFHSVIYRLIQNCYPAWLEILEVMFPLPGAH
jgi:hypothetical protein